jgi:hypothetical protein
MTIEGLGHNRPPLADEIALAYSPEQLAQTFDALAQEVTALESEAAKVGKLETPEEVAAATALVIRLREMGSRVEKAGAEIKRPVLDAGRNVDAFFRGINTVGREKSRIEGEIRNRAERIAAQRREEARQAAIRQQQQAEAAAKAAAEAEAANKPKVADVLITEAVRQEAAADKVAALASGPVQDMARERTSAGTVGLRGENGFNIHDMDALRSSMGRLGPHLKADAIGQAIRAFRDAQGKMPFRDDDQDSMIRILVSTPPLPGVEFFIEYKASVRA